MKDEAGATAMSEQLRDELEAQAHALAPELPPLALAPGLAEAILDEAEVPSSSGPHYYRLVRTPGGWQHADSTCRGWLFRGTCRHVKEKNMESTALVATNTNVLAIIDEIEDSAIAEDIRSGLTEVWVYEFTMGGKNITGVSSKGVENGCRELAKKGEAIRELDVKVEYEDDREARFVAQAGRYAVNAEGKDVLLDVAIRAKRQSKWETRQNGSVVFDNNWYEKGVTKAARNAKLALMPDSIVALIIAEAKKQGRTRQVQSPRQNQRQVQQPRPDGVDQDGVITEPTPTAPTDLLNAIAKKYGAQTAGAARGVLPVHFGTGDLLKLKDDQRAQFAAYLRVWLEEPKHEHEPAYTPEGRPVCGRCGVLIEEPAQASGNAQQPALTG